MSEKSQKQRPTLPCAADGEALSDDALADVSGGNLPGKEFLTPREKAIDRARDLYNKFRGQ